MLTRRELMLSGPAGLLAIAVAQPASAAAPAPEDPAGIITAIYTRAAKGKGDGGGAFIIESNAVKAKYLSKSLVELWAKADAHTPKGDVGPVDFDPVANSQEPDIKSFKVVAEKTEADKAVIAVTFSPAATRRRASRRIGPCATISCARQATGRSTTSRVPATASRGRSGRCLPHRSRASGPSGRDEPADPRAKRNYCGCLASS